MSSYYRELQRAIALLFALYAL